MVDFPFPFLITGGEIEIRLKIPMTKIKTLEHNPQSPHTEFFPANVVTFFSDPVTALILIEIKSLCFTTGNMWVWLQRQTVR